MSASDDSTRPLSVADLLARNGTIGSPPVGGRRRRRRRKGDGVSVAELTGEIPVIRPEEIPVAGEYDESDDDYEYYEDESDEDYVGEESAPGEAADEDRAEDTVHADEEAGVEDSVAESSETVVIYASAEAVESEVHELEVDDSVTEDAVEDVAPTEIVADSVGHPPLASDPMPRRSDRLEPGYDPRPVRRSSGAEQMAYDPVDESVDLADLVDEHAEDAEQLRSYLLTSQDTLFSGGTVADDIARRGADSGDVDEYETAATDQAVASASGPARPRQFGSTLWNSVLAVLQSLLAVVFGAALFIGFDQLWRWNTLVALILSVLVVLTLAAAVRIVRKTEDIVSTLTAVAVGLLVTLGPLALQST